MAEMDQPTGRRHILRWTLLVILGSFLVIQLVPYGRTLSNPPVTMEPAWNSPQTRALAVSSCYDCHSNETNTYWYSKIAPFSWLIQHDVDDGRSVLNFSEWDRPQEGTGDVAEPVNGGEMPPWYYSLIHSGARLSDAEKQQLIAGLQATFQASPPIAAG
jgi:mono/diheme cytochrome c family protein